MKFSEENVASVNIIGLNTFFIVNDKLDVHIIYHNMPRAFEEYITVSAVS